MDSRLLICVVALLLGCLVAESQAVISHAEFKKRLLSMNPGMMTPQCKKVFRNCSMKMLSLMGLLDSVKSRWEDYAAIPCVKTLLESNFPDYSLECSRSGVYGKSVACLEGPEATASLDPKQAESLKGGLLDVLIHGRNTPILKPGSIQKTKCLLDNSLP